MSQSIRSLAAEAGVPVRECLHRLHGAGLKASAGAQRLDGPELASARRAVGLERRRAAAAAAAAAVAARRELGAEEMIVRLLRPLREKGKVGREHTTPVENVWGRGFPDHRKADAKDLVEELLGDGCLGEKESQGRRHVWLTNEGQARLRRAEDASTSGGVGTSS